MKDTTINRSEDPYFLKVQEGYIGPWTIEYDCIHCEGVTVIKITKVAEKVTYPMIEFCPFCGMSNEWQKARDEDEL